MMTLNNSKKLTIAAVALSKDTEACTDAGGCGDCSVFEAPGCTSIGPASQAAQLEYPRTVN